MISVSDQFRTQFGRTDGIPLSHSSNVFYQSDNINIEDQERASVVAWMNGLLPSLHLPIEASSEELRSHLSDGLVLLQILNKLKPGFEKEGNDTFDSSGSENFKVFLESMDELGIPRFDITDLEKGCMKNVLDCLLALRGKFSHVGDRLSSFRVITRCKSNGDLSSLELCSPQFEEDNRVLSPESAFQQALINPKVLEPSSPLMVHQLGHKFHEVFQLKQGRYIDLSAAKISEMMKSNSLNNAPTQSLLIVVNGILDEIIDRNNGEIPQRVACLLRKVMQQIEQRISTQAEHLRTQNNVLKAREEKYYSRIRVLENLAAANVGESKITKVNREEKKNVNEEEMKKMVEKMEQKSAEIEALKRELEMAKKMHELRCLQMETEAKDTKARLEDRLKESEDLLEDKRKKIKRLEASSDSKEQSWKEKEYILTKFLLHQFGAMRELRLSSQSIKRELKTVEDRYLEEFHQLGAKIKTIIGTTENYHLLLAENRKMFNDLQDIKGNIRVCCRVRPFLYGQVSEETMIEHIGEDGVLIIANHSKPGKDDYRQFRFNKVYGPDSTQAEVFLDAQPLIRSVLDGYNVCIFAYGQTGSGKTYTMTGPSGASEEEWGVNYRVLHDLFKLSKSRSCSFTYEVDVQMVEIYNEQVRDLLASDGTHKRLGIVFNSLANGLAVPEASMHPVTSTSDVVELMNIGLNNRAVGATAMNERSSRSHSVVSIHVRGKDLHTGAYLNGNLHLVDLAGSERVDHSEVTGDRLKEAQHINKSLSALGDVIFALAQKNPHVPYRNSKLTQLLQSSLGGHAKTLMFVQLNPDAISYSETLSTLKFAERVSGIELGAARSSKEGKDVRELMEQMASLKNMIAKKDEEIERFQLLKRYHDLNRRKQVAGVHKPGHSSVNHDAASVTSQLSYKSSVSTPADEQGYSSDDTETDPQQIIHDFKHQNRCPHQSKFLVQETDDASSSSGAEHHNLTDQDTGSSANTQKRNIVSKSRSLLRSGLGATATVLVSKEAHKSSQSPKKATNGVHSSAKPSRRWQWGRSKK